jgi:hypothetical protein
VTVPAQQDHVVGGVALGSRQRLHASGPPALCFWPNVEGASLGMDALQDAGMLGLFGMERARPHPLPWGRAIPSAIPAKPRSSK